MSIVKTEKIAERQFTRPLKQAAPLAHYLWMVEFSKEQQCFHYDLLSKSINTNFSALVEDNFQPQFVPVAGPFNSPDEAANAIPALRLQFEACGLLDATPTKETPP